MKNTVERLIGSAALGLCAVLASPAGISGTLYEYQYSDPSQDLATYISLDDSDVFRFAFNPLEGYDAFWFVVTEGPMPLSESEGNYAVFISDFNDVWAYQYKGWDNNYLSTSWQNQPLLQYWENAISPHPDSEDAFSLELDLANLNGLTPDGNTNWKGLDFADRIGVWWHTSSNSNLEGDVNGISSYDPRRWNWGLDFANGGTTYREFEDNLPPPPPMAVPAPASLLLLACGLLLLAWCLRHRAARTRAGSLRVAAGR